MGCVGLVIAGLLALAIPASIAPSSLVGAYVVIAVLTAIAAAALWARSRRRVVAEAADLPIRSRRTAIVTVAALTVLYALIVTAIHFATR